MADVLTPEQRRRNMSAIRGKDTGPELAVRRLIHSMGYRYRLYGKELPGRPDLVFRARQKIIFVHGCFWHMHACKQGHVTPRTNAAFWSDKRAGNVKRDRRNIRALRACGWHVFVVWECQTRDLVALAKRVARFLKPEPSSRRRARKSEESNQRYIR